MFNNKRFTAAHSFGLELPLPLSIVWLSLLNKAHKRGGLPEANLSEITPHTASLEPYRHSAESS